MDISEKMRDLQSIGVGKGYGFAIPDSDEELQETCALLMNFASFAQVNTFESDGFPKGFQIHMKPDDETTKLLHDDEVLLIINDLSSYQTFKDFLNDYQSQNVQSASP